MNEGGSAQRELELLGSTEFDGACRAALQSIHEAFSGLGYQEQDAVYGAVVLQLAELRRSLQSELNSSARLTLIAAAESVGLSESDVQRLARRERVPSSSSRPPVRLRRKSGEIVEGPWGRTGSVPKWMRTFLCEEEGLSEEEVKGLKRSEQLLRLESYWAKDAGASPEREGE